MRAIGFVRGFRNSGLFLAVVAALAGITPVQAAPGDPTHDDPRFGTLVLSHPCEMVPGDANGDGDADLGDFASLALCLEALGPAVAATHTCALFDADVDDDVDLRDTASFSAQFTSTANGAIIHLTLLNDFLGGTSGPDIFIADLALDAATQSLIPTISNADDLFGGAGNDTFSATLNYSVPTQLGIDAVSIETIEIMDGGTAQTTIGLGEYADACQIITYGSTNPQPTLFWLDEIIAVAVSEHGAGISLKFYPSDVTFGADDVLALTLEDASGGVFSFETGTANGVETVAIVSEGTANRLDSIVQIVGNTFTEVKVAGDAPLVISQPLPPTVSRFDASESSGGVFANVSTATGATTTLGGDGDDTFVLGGSYMPQDVVDGGGGHDALLLTSSTAAGAAQVQGNVTNMEELIIADRLVHDIDLRNFEGARRLRLLNGTSIPVDDIGGPTIQVAEGTVVKLDAGADSAADLYFKGQGTGRYGGAKSLTIALNGHDCFRLRSLLVDEVHLESNRRPDGGPADANVNIVGGLVELGLSNETALLVTGSTDLYFLNEIHTDTLDARGFTGDLRMFPQAHFQASGPWTIYGGSGDDTLFAYYFGVDVDAGPGNDVVDGLFFGGTVSLGPGNDTFRVAGLQSPVNRITDFVAGAGGEKINIDRDAIGTLDGTNNFTNAGSMQVHDYPEYINLYIPTEIVQVTSGTIADFSAGASQDGTNLLAAIGGTVSTTLLAGQYVFLVGDIQGNTGVYFASAGNNMSFEESDFGLLVILENTSVGSLHYTNFSNVN